MKKFTKVMLVIATILVVIGVFCVIWAVALGLTWGSFSDMVKSGKFSFNGNDFLGVIETEIGETKSSYKEIDESCTSMDIEFGSGVLEIYYGDVENIRVEQENVSNFKCYVDERTLHVEGNTRAGIQNQDRKIVVILPKGTEFTEVDLEVGAGKADIAGLIANEFSIEVGAGEANVTGLDVEQLNAETGAGKLYIQAVGNEEDYNYDLECDIGELNVGNHSYSGLGREQRIQNPGAKRFMDVECGVGQIEIKFEE